MTETAVAVLPTPAPSPSSTADPTSVSQLIASLAAAGAEVVNHGWSGQGLFPGEGIGLWHLTLNDAIVNVYEFSETTAREAVSDNISPRGDEYTVTEGDTTVKTTWDSEGLSRWWTLDNLLVHYSGSDEAVIPLLTAVLGQPFADGSRPYRPEAGSGSIAGIGEYGVSFQYDPYLAAGIQPQIADAFTEDNGMTYLLLPRHLAFIFTDSYTDADPLLQRQQLNLETMPQIVVYPAAAYAAMHPLAEEQIEQLQALLEAQPPISDGTLPYLPLHNAAQVFHSHVAYLPFADGAGVRYVTAFSQEASPITNQQLIYTFQGLTGDGQYYVAAFFPLMTDALPDTVEVEDWEAFGANFTTYLSETTAVLEQLAPAAFTPDLSLLDAVVTSLRIEAEGLPFGVEPALSSQPPAVPSPGLVYRAPEGLWGVGADSEAQLLTERVSALPAPDAAHAVYMDDDRRLWLIDLTHGGERQLAPGFDFSWLYQWGDEDTLLVGVWLTPAESEGVATGHVAMLDVDTDELLVVDEEFLSLGRPALAPDGETVAYDISAFSTDATTGRIYQTASGSRPLDPALFDGLEEEQPCNLYNPAWSPDGKQLAWLCGGEAGSRLVVFDLTQQTATTVLSWQPAQLGALPPSPTWSPDSQWLVVEIWADNEAESGLWLAAADGHDVRRISPTSRSAAVGSQPVWLSSREVTHVVCDENVNNCENRLIDIRSGSETGLDLPAGSVVLLMTDSGSARD